MGALSGSHVWHGGHWPSPQAECGHAAGAPLPNEWPSWPHNRARDQWWVWSEAQRLLTGRGQLTTRSQALRSCWELRTAGDGNAHLKREQGGRQCDRTAKGGAAGNPSHSSWVTKPGFGGEGCWWNHRDCRGSSEGREEPGGRGWGGDS